MNCRRIHMRNIKAHISKKVLWIGAAAICVFTTGVFFWRETRWEINYHSGCYRKSTILLKCFSFQTGEGILEEYLHFINHDTGNIPDRWDFYFSKYRNLQGQIRVDAGPGGYIMKLISFYDCKNMTPEQKDLVVKELITILHEEDRNKRDYKIMEFYYRPGNVF